MKIIRLIQLSFCFWNNLDQVEFAAELTNEVFTSWRVLDFKIGQEVIDLKYLHNPVLWGRTQDTESKTKNKKNHIQCSTVGPWQRHDSNPCSADSLSHLYETSNKPREVLLSHGVRKVSWRRWRLSFTLLDFCKGITDSIFFLTK